MALIPLKDRTIKLTLESALAAKNGLTTKKSAKEEFTNQFIPTTGVLGAAAKALGLAKADPTITLVGPTSLDISYEQVVGEDIGPFTSFLQPWFIKPVKITISGESYLGAYVAISRSDKDAYSLLQAFKTAANDFSGEHGTPGNRSRILLEIKNNPKNARKFIGYLQRFSFKEQVNNPYMLSYDLVFVGRDVYAEGISTGQQNGRDAQARSGR